MTIETNRQRNTFLTIVAVDLAALLAIAWFTPALVAAYKAMFNFFLFNPARHNSVDVEGWVPVVVLLVHGLMIIGATPVTRSARTTPATPRRPYPRTSIGTGWPATCSMGAAACSAM